MSRFAILEKIDDDELNYGHVYFYSVRLEEFEHNEFERFIERFKESADVRDEFNNLLSKLEQIQFDGVRDHFFRHEQNAQALPPQVKFMDFIYEHDLRLYCCKITSETLIIFGGNIKTTRQPQDCPNTAGHFRLANELAIQIGEKIKEREIIVAEDGELQIRDEKIDLYG